MPDLPREIRRLLIATAYFTRIPIPAWVGWSAFELNRAARYFPLVGMGVGLVAAGVLAAASLLLPPMLAVLLSMAASILLTGAFHEDGLADAADGFGGGCEPDQVLAIMQDSRIGSFGTVALVLVLLSKFAALLTLASVNLPFAMVALVIAHAASRACALAVMAVLSYVRLDGAAKAKPVAEGLGVAEWGTGILLGALPLGVALALHGVPAHAAVLVLLVSLSVPACAARYFRRRIGGYTGDCLGAVQQLAELAIYLALCARTA